MDCRERTARDRMASTGWLFSGWANAQSGFKDRIRRMQCDQNPGLRASRVDFWQRLGKRGRRFPQARFWIASGLPTNRPLKDYRVRLDRPLSQPSVIKQHSTRAGLSSAPPRKAVRYVTGAMDCFTQRAAFLCGSNRQRPTPVRTVAGRQSGSIAHPHRAGQ